MENQHKQPLHTSRIPVRWRDLDDFSHVNSATYFTYFEQARVEFFEKEVLGMKEKGFGPAVITNQCTYLKQIRYPNVLKVTMSIGEIGRTSFVLHYQIVCEAEPDVLCAEGSSKIVWVDYRIGKSAPLPEEIQKYAA